MNRKLKFATGIVVLLAILCLLAVRYLRMGSGEPLNIAGGEYFDDAVQLEVPLYLQTNPAWAEDRIGSGEKMKNVGCTVCSVAMAFSYHGVEVSPKELNQFLLDNGGYNNRGWLRWQKCAEFAKGSMQLGYVGSPKYEIIDRNLKKGNPVIVKVFINGVIPHWVLVTGKTGHDYYINDPLNERGGAIKLSEYGEKMYSLRVFEKT